MSIDSENMVSELKELFKCANNAFIEKNRHLFDVGVSERTLCGALMVELYESLKQSPFNNYYVDVEYNRVGDKYKMDYKTIEGPQQKVSNVSCDLIVHNRGKNGEHDNLIALEMKKDYRKEKDKSADKNRLRFLTYRDFCDIRRVNGRKVSKSAYGYELGVYYEIRYKGRQIYIEYYVNGKMNDKYELNIPK